MSLGEKLYRLRTERGIFLKELAAYLHMSISAVSSYENDVHLPDLKTLGMLAEYFNVSVDYLLNRTEYKAPIESVGRELIGQYSISDFVNTVIELSSERQQELINYIGLLKQSDEAENQQKN